jgi:hypothetical protein
MNSNIGSVDRAVRLGVGGAMAATGLAAFAGLVDLSGVVAALAVLLGLVLVGTALVRVCLLYRLVGLDTSGSR